MTESTIICPNCKTEIKLTESLAAPLIESTRRQFEQQLAQKDSDIAAREQAMREKEKQLADAKNKLNEQVADQVEEQLKKDRSRIVAEEAKKAKQAAATDLEQKTREVADLQEVLKSREEKLEAQKAQATASASSYDWKILPEGQNRTASRASEKDTLMAIGVMEWA